MGESVCWYRQGKSLLWSESETSCSKEDLICKRIPPEIPALKEAIDFGKEVKKQPKQKRLPHNLQALTLLLREKAAKNEIVWINDENKAEIYKIIQNEIDNSSPAQDVHVVFGFAEYIEGQIPFFNELISLGKDGIKINGITHLGIESCRVDKLGNEYQSLLDNYLLTGRGREKFVLAEAERTGPQIKEYDSELGAANYTINLAYQNCYNAYFADLNAANINRMMKKYGEYYTHALRHLYSVKSFIKRERPDKKDVVFWPYGGIHGENKALPYAIKRSYPQAKVISIIVNGGSYIDAYSFDRALKRLGWLERSFIMKLSGYQDGDLVIHIPTEGRKRMHGIDRSLNPVLHPIIDPPKRKKGANQ